ncbi:MAG: hypothetical protein R3E48_03540 [Burkholderiaceae bacterium]
MHRKDVRSLREHGATGDPARSTASDAGAPSATRPGAADALRRSLNLAEQVFTRWTTNAAYRRADGRPERLLLAGAAPSFEALVASITRDVSRRTVLDELVGLGLVREIDGWVEPLADTMSPRQGLAEVARYFADHLHDHLAAGAANVDAVAHGRQAPFLEHSLYGGGLSPESIEYLAALARSLWQPVFTQMVDAARQRHGSIAPVAPARCRPSPDRASGRRPGGCASASISIRIRGRTRRPDPIPVNGDPDDETGCACASRPCWQPSCSRSRACCRRAVATVSARAVPASAPSMGSAAW